ncbi:putative Carboxylic ester hydrolase [Seiridium cardinale]
MAATLAHSSLGATLHGVKSDNVWQFRGLSYASIPHRFASPAPPADLSGDVDCTRFGPRCPQNHIDARHLLRIPEDEPAPEEVEDELGCLNLDVTMSELPNDSGARSTAATTGPPLPVVAWIHGGSQTVSFGSAASRVCDPTCLVATSVKLGTPIIVVTISYRLNAFAFGDSTSERNLALRDQKAALQYLKSHGAGFGGDPENITLIGESAGAVYCHAHMVSKSPIRQCILQSGSLHLSPPQQHSVANGLIDSMSQGLRRLGNWTLRDAPVSSLLEVQRDLGLVSFYLQMEQQLEGWSEMISGSVERLLIGDTEYEAALWRNGIETLSGEYISQAFDLFEDDAVLLKKLYGIVADRPSSCKIGALDFLNDTRFTLPVETMVEQWRNSGQPVFRYLVDQPNPWQSSSRAHHAVDLLFVFGAFDLTFDRAAQRVSSDMQQKWIQFICGKDPWQPQDYWAFGPCGECRTIDHCAFEARRRSRHLSALKAAGPAKVNAVYKTLALGRLSLLN